MNLDALLQSFGNFIPRCRHFIPVFEAEHVHFFRAKANSRAGDIESFGDFRHVAHLHSLLARSRTGDIDRHIPAADDDDFVSQLHTISQVDVEQKIDGSKYTVKLNAVNPEVTTFVCTDPDEH